MPALKKIDGRRLYLDMDCIWEPAPDNHLAMQRRRQLRQIDPFNAPSGRRPRAYRSPEELQRNIEAYFRKQERYMFDKWGNVMINPETGNPMKTTAPLTISGLARHLGISTNTLANYGKIAKSGTVPREYAEIVLDARQRIEEYAEARGYDKDGQKGSDKVLRYAFRWIDPLEQATIDKNKWDIQLAKEKLRMQQEEHELKMQLMAMGVDKEDLEDKEISITITRAGE